VPRPRRALPLRRQRPRPALTAHTRADGSRIEFRYDRAGRKVATVDPLGHETLIERGHPVEISGPEGTTAFAYDHADLPDRPTSLTDADPAQ